MPSRDFEERAFEERALRILRPVQYNKDPLAVAVEASRKRHEIPLTPVKKRKAPKIPPWLVKGTVAHDYYYTPRGVEYPMPELNDGSNRGPNVDPQLFARLPLEVKSIIVGYVLYAEKPPERFISLMYDLYSTKVPWTYHVPQNKTLLSFPGCSIGPEYAAAPKIARTSYSTFSYEKDVLVIEYPRCEDTTRGKSEHRSAFRDLIHQLHNCKNACQKLQYLQVSFCPRHMTADDILGLICMRYNSDDEDDRLDHLTEDEIDNPLKALQSVIFKPHVHNYHDSFGEGLDSVEEESRVFLINENDLSHGTDVPFEVECWDAIGEEVKTLEEKAADEQWKREEPEREEYMKMALGYDHWRPGLYEELTGDYGPGGYYGRYHSRL